MLTVPDGSAESFVNVDWIACNLEHPPSQWDGARQRAAAQGVKVIPWVRLARIDQGETWEHVKQRLSLLKGTAQSWGEDTILPNYEDECETFPPDQVADYLYGSLGWGGNTGWSTLAWLANDPDFTAINDDPVLLQIFQKDNRWEPSQIPTKLGDCVAHARGKGFTYVGVTYQTYADALPSWYDCGAFMHSTFPGNVIAHGEWDKWYP